MVAGTVGTTRRCQGERKSRGVEEGAVMKFFQHTRGTYGTYPHTQNPLFQTVDEGNSFHFGVYFGDAWGMLGFTRSLIQHQLASTFQG